MRRVKVYKKIYDKDTKEFLTEELGEALFHQFSLSYDEFEYGVGNYPVAIIEWPDGSVESVYAENIKFLDKPFLKGIKCQMKFEN